MANTINRVRKKKGTSVGGQFAVDPNGPLSQKKQSQVLGPNPQKIAEDAAKAAFKKRKKEAMDRFLAKQRAEKAARNKIGLPGPVTMKRREKVMAGKDPGGVQFQRKLQRYEREAHRQGRLGINTIEQQANLKTGQMTAGGQHKWARVLGAPDRQLVKGPGKGQMTLRMEKHQRHKDARAAKEREVFLEGKRIAGRRHLAKKKGEVFITPPKPNVGDISAGGKFFYGQKYNARGRRMRDKGGQLKGTWQLIPTERRAGFVPPQAGPANLPRVNIPAPPKQWQPPKPGHVYVDDKGRKLVVADKQPKNGIFQKVVVVREDGSKGLLKTDGILENRGRGPGTGDFGGIKRGFAQREVLSSDVSKMLGLDIVPETDAVVMSNDPVDQRMGSYHSIQTWIEGTDLGENFDASDLYRELADKEEVGKMMMLDTLLGNTDRHGQNWLVGGKPGARKLYAIDNGLAMVNDEEVAHRVARDWYSNLSTPVRQIEGGKAVLNPKYRDRLSQAIADGSLKQMLDTVHANSTYAGNRRKYAASAALKRAQSMVDNWYDIFKDN